ncbi:hypothetical protein EVJ58_g8439 [Rhodofomes roseus]|uniref:Uncharacterized protein n=1 Tax=Rhodofomes roseus TaxID=34475 RepID=A0A4Y9Y081_9APHY|nr:hypothetical protein EVJ58_g8439 [Rhodofomes roseus]
MPGPQSWNSARVIPVSALDIREIRYTLGTVHASSVFTELGGRLAWMFLDRYLTSLLADHPHLVPNFNLDIDFDGEHADWHASLADIEDSFDMNLPMMVENGSRMCAIVQFSIDETGRPGKFYREIRWPKEPVATTPAGVQPDASTTG